MPNFINSVQQVWISGEESLVHKIVVFNPCKSLIEKHICYHSSANVKESQPQTTIKHKCKLIPN